MNSKQAVKIFNEWIKERDKVVKTYDIDAFKAFWHKWQAKGVYDKQMSLPSDNVIEISMRKMVYHMTSATSAEKKEAEEWLYEHGSSPTL